MKGLSWYQTGKSSNFCSGARHVGADGMWGSTTSFSSGFVAARVKSRAGRRRVRIDVMLESEETCGPAEEGEIQHLKDPVSCRMEIISRPVDPSNLNQS